MSRPARVVDSSVLYAAIGKFVWGSANDQPKSNDIRWIKEFMTGGTVDTALLVESKFPGINKELRKDSGRSQVNGKWPAVNIGDDFSPPLTSRPATSVKIKDAGRMLTISAYRGISGSVSSAAYSAGASAQQWGIFMFVDEDAVYDPQNPAFFDDAYDIVSIDMTTKSVSILAPYGVPVTPETIKSALAADPRLPEVVGYVGTRTFQCAGSGNRNSHSEE
ncbi:hypothetical protein CHS0354_030066 [Potamilus streckersoni]|uniref:Uncharacterized protein n=1 Tax=Potamilus streckersoni TaxID=2493646 RepID=A0AAE0RLM2_9BIVA|nr:hypothetical protein CHS0354_030066 [Potamilus streckersoni]